MFSSPWVLLLWNGSTCPIPTPSPPHPHVQKRLMIFCLIHFWSYIWSILIQNQETFDLIILIFDLILILYLIPWPTRDSMYLTTQGRQIFAIQRIFLGKKVTKTKTKKEYISEKMYHHWKRKSIPRNSGTILEISGTIPGISGATVSGKRNYKIGKPAFPACIKNVWYFGSTRYVSVWIAYGLRRLRYIFLYVSNRCWYIAYATSYNII